MATTPVLSIETLIERQTVRIDGTAYELRNSDELTLFQLTRLQRIADRANDIGKDVPAEAPSIEHLDEYDRLLADAMGTILVAPSSVVAKLKTAHREAILWTFIGLSQPSLGRARAMSDETPMLANPKTRSRSVPGSRGSTAARRRSG